MNPFEELLKQTKEHEMARSQSFDLSSVVSQEQRQMTSVASAIGCDPARMSGFLGHHVLMHQKPSTKLETIHENTPTITQNFSSQLSAQFRSNQFNDQQSSDKTNISIRGSVSSWNL